MTYQFVNIILMRTRDDWQKELDSNGLGIFAPLFLMHWQVCAQIELDDVGDYSDDGEPVDKTPTGSSKAGGRPDVPAGFEWPTVEYDDGDIVAIPFLAQIRMEAIAEMDEASALPHSGLLSFFFDFSLEYDDWRVVHFTDLPDSFERLAFPDNLPENGIESSQLMNFERSDSLPSIRSSEIEKPFERIAEENGIVDTSELYRLMDKCQSLRTPNMAGHLLLGHDAVGSGKTNAANWWRENYDEPVGQSAQDWRLLFQLDEGNCAGINLGGGSGDIVFLIRNVDLANGNFDDVYAAYLK